MQLSLRSIGRVGILLTCHGSLLVLAWAQAMAHGLFMGCGGGAEVPLERTVTVTLEYPTELQDFASKAINLGSLYANANMDGEPLAGPQVATVEGDPTQLTFTFAWLDSGTYYLHGSAYNNAAKAALKGIEQSSSTQFPSLDECLTTTTALAKPTCLEAFTEGACEALIADSCTSSAEASLAKASADGTASSSDVELATYAVPVIFTDDPTTQVTVTAAQFNLSVLPTGAIAPAVVDEPQPSIDDSAPATPEPAPASEGGTPTSDPVASPTKPTPMPLTVTKRQSGTVVHLNDVTYGAGRFVAAGDYGVVLVSFDGITWEHQESGTDQDLSRILYANGQFIASFSSSVSNDFFVSVNGQQWTKVSPPASEENCHMNDYQKVVLYGNGLFVTSHATPNTVCLSKDAKSWTLQTTDVPLDFLSGTFGQGLFVLGGKNGSLVSSKNGQVWTTAPLESQDGDVRRLFFTNEQFFAYLAYKLNPAYTPYDYYVAFTSFNGTEWYNLGTTIPPVLKKNPAFGNGTIIGIGDPHSWSLYSSPDGISWQEINTILDKFNGLAFGNGKFVAVGNFGIIGTVE